MSADQPSRPTSSRSGMPMGSTVAIVVAAVAVLLGLLVLKKITDDDPSTTEPVATLPNTDPPVDDTTPAGGTTTPPPGTSDTGGGATAGTKTGATVQVANASNSTGVAKLASNLLKDEGFTTGEPVSTSTKIDKTIVYYVSGDTAAEAVAATVAEAMCAGDPKELPAAYATDPKLAATTGVVVALGNDKAGKTLAKMCASSTKTDTKSTTADTSADVTDGT